MCKTVWGDRAGQEYSLLMTPARQACAWWGHSFQRVLEGDRLSGVRLGGGERTLECPSVEKEEETSPQKVHWEHGHGDRK